METEHYLSDDHCVIIDHLGITISGYDSDCTIAPKHCADFAIVAYEVVIQSPNLSMKLDSYATIQDFIDLARNLSLLGPDGVESFSFPNARWELPNTPWGPPYCPSFKLEIESTSHHFKEWSLEMTVCTPVEWTDETPPPPPSSRMEDPYALRLSLASHLNFDSIDAARRASNEFLRIISSYQEES